MPLFMVSYPGILIENMLGLILQKESVDVLAFAVTRYMCIDLMEGNYDVKQT